MATLPKNAEINQLLTSQIPYISPPVATGDDFQYQQACLSFLSTEYETNIQPSSFQHGKQPQENLQALPTHPEQPSRLSSASPYVTFAMENPSAPTLARYGDSQLFADNTFGSWNGKFNQQLASHNRIDSTHISPFTPGFLSENISVIQMMANTLGDAANGGTSQTDGCLDTSPQSVKHFSYNLEMIGGNVGLAIDSSKGGLAIQALNNYTGPLPFSTFPANAMFANTAENVSLLNMESTLLQSTAPLGAAGHLIRDERDLTTSNNSASRRISLNVPTCIDTPLTSAANSPCGHEAFQQSAMKDRPQGLASTANGYGGSNSNMALMGALRMVSGSKPNSLPIPVEIEGSDGMGKPGNSMDESDGSLGLEVSSGCENGWETAAHVNASGKKKRLKKKSKNSAMQLGDGKDFECENVIDKRQKIGDDFSEEDQGKKMESNDSDDSTHPTTKETSKPPDTTKPDYIHVRARRGQATDSHSLAERIRREKISERMKFLQDLVPGCSKITGKAVMLDEIINYVQSLQRQVEFLSMKLAAVNPRVDFNMDSLFRRDMFPPQLPQQPQIFTLENPHAYTQLRHQSSQPSLRVGGHGGVPRPLVDVQSLGGSDPVFKETISTPLTSKDSLGQIVSQAYQARDDELQNLLQTSYAQGNQTPRE